jgi:glycosyltransferase involved in cell wall biosynthesis
MRLCVALPGIHRVDRGAEVAFETVADLLAQRPDCDVHVFGSGEPRPGRHYRYTQVACVPRDRFEGWPQLPMFRDECAWEELTFAWNLRRAYEPADFDLTLTAGYPFLNWFLRLGRRAGSPAHVYVTENSDWPAHYRGAEFRFFSCDGLICVNPEHEARNRARWHCALIPNGVDVERFAPTPRRRERFGIPDDARVVLMVSALIDTKNVASGIRAAAKLPGQFLLIAGDGPLRGEMDGLAARLLPGRYRRVVVPRDEIGDVFRCADVFLHLAREESCPIACMEAVAAGLPVVAQDSAVARWLLEDQATFVEGADEAAVAAALDAAPRLDTPEHRAARAALAQRRSWVNIAERYYEFLRELHARCVRGRA